LEKPIVCYEFDLITKLKNVCIKIPLLQVIKYIPIYANTVRGFFLKKYGRKKIEPKTIQFIGKSTYLMLGHIFIKKYVDSGNPIVSIHMNSILIPNTLINLGEKINIMTKETME
jgi:hypothetical protein